MKTNKFYKIFLIIVSLAILLASYTYYKRMTIDIGCAKERQKMDQAEQVYDDYKRSFKGINCQSWEKK